MKSALMLGFNPNAKREKNDFYATDPNGLRKVLPLMKELGLTQNVWECACGMGHLSEVLKSNGYNVFSSDLIDRGYGNEEIDFLKTEKKFDGDLLTNPPFKYAENFVKRGFELINDGNKIWLFLKVQFLESAKRAKLFDEYPLKILIVNSERVCCAMNGDFDKYFNFNQKDKCYKGGTQFYCWYVFEKGYKGKPYIERV